MIPVRNVLALACDVLSEAPAGIFLDIDGTLSPIAPSADQATVSSAAQRAIAALSRRLALVAVVSGREVCDARRLVGLEHIVYIGDHGAQRLENGRVRGATDERRTQDLGRLLAAIARTVDMPGLQFEHKGVTGAVHFRKCANPQQARATVLDVLATLPERGAFVVSEGRKVINLMPADAPHKGSAVSDLITERGLRGAVYLGDDRTDMDAFADLRRLRQAGSCRTLSIAILSPEAPPDLARSADLTLQGVHEVEELLPALAHCDRSAPR